MATERVDPGDLITVTLPMGAAESDGYRGLRKAASDLGMAIDESMLRSVVVTRDPGNPASAVREFSTRVWTDECRVCGKALGGRHYPLDSRPGRRDWDQRAHGPCKGFNERRIADGFPNARDDAELRKLVRFAQARGE